MNPELEIYKNNKIAALKSAFNQNLSRLNSTLAANIKSVNNSRISSKQKQQQINNLIAQYNTNKNSLVVVLNNAILSVQKFQPSQINVTGNKKALLVGINYIGTQNELYGCINDVNCIKERITKNGFNNITTITDKTVIKPTKLNILNAFKNLLINSKSGDLLFFAYSGHGSYDIDKNGDETTGYDQMICPLDMNFISDDELKSIIQANLKQGVTLFAMFDSCFSGSVLDLRYQYLDSLDYDNFTENNKQLETLGNVFMISGCSDYQTSADAVINNNDNGAMTWSLLESLKEKPNCSWRELLKSMRDLLKVSEFDQIPQFSSGKFENIDLKVFI